MSERFETLRRVNGAIYILFLSFFLTCCHGGWRQGVTGVDSMDAVRPRLWCGLTSGKLLVYDVLTWVQEECHVCAADCIVSHFICVELYLTFSSSE